MKLLLLLCLVPATFACKERAYNYALSLGVPGTFAEVSYQYPHGPTITVYRKREVLQEIYLSDDLGRRIEQYKIPGGFALKGEDKEIQITLSVSQPNFYEFKVFRELLRTEQVRDCIMLGNDTHWYGGPEHFIQQYWPVQKQRHQYDTMYVPQRELSMAIMERIWVNSKGVYAYIDYKTPLFITQDPYNSLCLKAYKGSPYNQDETRFTYALHVGVADNPRDAYLKAVEHHLGKPTGIPDERMILQPVYSTTVRYRKNINEEAIRTYAEEIQEHNFKHSQIEIDDMWETCYGSLTVDEGKFPDMKAMTDDLKENDFRTTLWVHPFINSNCQPWYDEAKERGYFTKDADGNTKVYWWNTPLLQESGTVDFTNPEAAQWFVDRLNVLKEATGIDSFKFDAGEASYATKVNFKYYWKLPYSNA